MAKSSRFCKILIAFIAFIIVVALIALGGVFYPYIATYLGLARSPYERIHFEDEEFDYWVKATPADVNETLDNVNSRARSSSSRLPTS